MEELKFYLSRSATTRLNLRTLFLSLSTTPALVASPSETHRLRWQDSSLSRGETQFAFLRFEAIETATNVISEKTARSFPLRAASGGTWTT